MSDVFSIDKFIECALKEQAFERQINIEPFFWCDQDNFNVIGNASIHIQFDKERLRREHITNLLKIFKVRRRPKPNTILQYRIFSSQLEESARLKFLENLEGKQDEQEVIKITPFSISNYKDMTMRLFVTKTEQYFFNHEYLKSCIDFSNNVTPFGIVNDVADMFDTYTISKRQNALRCTSSKNSYKDIKVYIAAARLSHYNNILSSLPNPEELFDIDFSRKIYLG